ncbi:uncharacterized protein RAG0_07530 [Rhynchosporium agropyri]|uniref:Uncharacterized protein n=1 Tax=Rhynchosporium agropyri TaxID=914238 RepID=A0A1E1KLZ1_9HELO|nr:uncharacterized protein RAG0_07530 [Rhynchosporium agropyri]
MATSNSIQSLPFCVVVGNGRGEMSCFCKATGMFQSNEHSHSHSGTAISLCLRMFLIQCNSTTSGILSLTAVDVGADITVEIPMRDGLFSFDLILLRGCRGTEILPVSSSVQPRPLHSTPLHSTPLNSTHALVFCSRHPQAQRHAIVGSQNGEADPGEADIISHG